MLLLSQTPLGFPSQMADRISNSPFSLSLTHTHTHTHSLSDVDAPILLHFAPTSLMALHSLIWSETYLATKIELLKPDYKHETIDIRCSWLNLKFGSFFLYNCCYIMSQVEYWLLVSGQLYWVNYLCFKKDRAFWYSCYKVGMWWNTYLDPIVSTVSKTFDQKLFESILHLLEKNFIPIYVLDTVKMPSWRSFQIRNQQQLIFTLHKWRM